MIQNRQTQPDTTTRLARHTAYYQNRLYGALLLIIGVAIAGTLGYRLLEGWDVLDALYMTIITMTTVGYGETRPLSDTGRWFTIGLIITSIGIAGYAVSTVAAFILEGEFYRLIQERRMDQRLAKLKHHVIVCGGGRTGKYIAEEFYRTQTPFVLVEIDPAALENAQPIGDFPYLQGDATDDDILKLAGIARARGLIAALGEDKDNVFIVLSARSLNPDLRVIARVNDDTNASKLIKAGADEIISPNAIGGLRMASVMIRPTVVSFLDEMLRVPDQTLRIDEVHIDSVPHLVGQTIGDANLGRRTGMLVVAIKSQSTGYRFNPGANTVLRSGDVLIVIGTPDQVAALHASDLGQEPSSRPDTARNYK
jgi:voltage-gated potassium channel